MGRPVVGYAHGGVAEILGELFPKGAVSKGDVEAAKRSANEILAGAADTVRANHRYLLGEMQAATLSLYATMPDRPHRHTTRRAKAPHA